jgi:hypothetical protein
VMTGHAVTDRGVDLRFVDNCSRHVLIVVVATRSRPRGSGLGLEQTRAGTSLCQLDLGTKAIQTSL